MADKEGDKMKEFILNDVEVGFWMEGKTLFCKVLEMGADIYCCGNKPMPETEAEALKLTETAWIW
jgi:hypothetical protein